MVGLLWVGIILIAMGWFAIGWVARGQENRKYAESRLRHLVGLELRNGQSSLVEDRARWEEMIPNRWEAQRVPPQPPTVVNVYLAAPSVPAWSQPPVIDAQLVPTLSTGKAPMAIEPG